jgi:hypothetical protein
MNWKIYEHTTNNNFLKINTNLYDIQIWVCPNDLYHGHLKTLSMENQGQVFNTIVCPSPIKTNILHIINPT